MLKQWKLTLYGSAMTFNEVKNRQRVVKEAMSGRYLDSGFSLPCPSGLDIPPEIVNPFTSNSLKFLLLLGCFALFWSLYYTLEVTMAHLNLKGLLCLRRRQGGPRVKWGLRRTGREEVVVEDGEEEECDSGVELHTVLDSEAKLPLMSGERPAT
ncbi:hypothetical protein LDENG_00073350 [Lucifuga dentata]|nr:hypothetical protein LDENG_00073350 [Lucifuga dentata]